MTAPLLQSDLPRFYRSVNGYFRICDGGSVASPDAAIPSGEVSPAVTSNLHPVPVSDEANTQPDRDRQKRPEVTTTFRSGEGQAREGNTPFGGDTCNTMRDSLRRGANTSMKIIGRDAKRNLLVAAICECCGDEYPVRKFEHGRTRFCSKTCHASVMRRTVVAAMRA